MCDTIRYDFVYLTCSKKLTCRQLRDKQNKNLAIANRSRVSCTDNALRASNGLNITPWPWNLG